MRVASSATLVLALALEAAALAAQATPISPDDREEAERFLQTAKVVDKSNIPIGVTRPQRLELSDGERSASAVWKTVQIYRPIQHFQDGGPPEIGFRDNYKHEVAAYELDKILMLNLVPPTVERRIRGQWGSLQLWLEDVISEQERMERKLAAPDTERWAHYMYNVRLFHNLTDNSDFNNVNNLLVDRDFRIWLIDSSRAFRTNKKLISEGDLEWFSRSVLGRLRLLSDELLSEKVGRWLTKAQIRTLLLRRDLILARAELLVAERGEDAVLFP